MPKGLSSEYSRRDCLFWRGDAFAIKRYRTIGVVDRHRAEFSTER